MGTDNGAPRVTPHDVLRLASNATMGLVLARAQSWADENGLELELVRARGSWTVRCGGVEVSDTRLPVALAQLAQLGLQTNRGSRRKT